MCLLYASTLAVVPPVLYFVVLPPDGLADVLVCVLFATLFPAVWADWRNWTRGGLREHPHCAADRALPYDITYDPTADPGQAAKRQWLKAVRRLPGRDDGSD